MITTQSLIEAVDAEVRAAIDDVDRTLITLALQQSPWDRLRSASWMAQTLTRIAAKTQAGRPKDRLALPILIATLQERDKQ